MTDRIRQRKKEREAQRKIVLGNREYRKWKCAWDMRDDEDKELKEENKRNCKCCFMGVVYDNEKKCPEGHGLTDVMKEGYTCSICNGKYPGNTTIRRCTSTICKYECCTVCSPDFVNCQTVGVCNEVVGCLCPGSDCPRPVPRISELWGYYPTEDCQERQLCIILDNVNKTTIQFMDVEQTFVDKKAQWTDNELCVFTKNVDDINIRKVDRKKFMKEMEGDFRSPWMPWLEGPTELAKGQKWLSLGPDPTLYKITNIYVSEAPYATTVEREVFVSLQSESNPEQHLRVREHDLLNEKIPQRFLLLGE